jgi:Uma2 family endonuclease
MKKRQDTPVVGSPEPGPFRAWQIPEGAPYELSNGHPIRCMSAGERHGDASARGVAVLETDPAVDGAGVDVGVEFNEGRNLRAPDISVGNTLGRPGWSQKLPPLAVEVADGGQDEADLQDKIRELLAAGTRYVWVVRMTGPRRVEVYQKGRRRQIVPAGKELRAEGVLQNPVPVLAFYERDVAHEVTLRNLLQRRGIESLEALWERARSEGEAKGEARGQAEGEARGLREAVRSLCEVLEIPLTPRRQARIDRLDAAALGDLLAPIKRQRRWPR